MFNVIHEGETRFDSLLAVSNLELKYAQIAKDTSFIVDAYVRYGLAYTIVHNSRRSLKYLHEALKIANTCKNDTLRIRALQGFSDTYLGKNKPELARPYIEEIGRIYEHNLLSNFHLFTKRSGTYSKFE